MLRIGTTTGGQVEVKLPGRARQGLPISVQRMPAGKHKVDFFLAGDSTASCLVKVLPDQRTVVMFNGKSCLVKYL